MMWEDHRQDCEPRDENLHSWTYVVKDVQQWNNQSESRCCACHSRVCVCVCLSSLLSQGEADSRPRQWNSHDQPEGVTALPGKHDSVWNILTSSNTSLHSLEFFFFFYMFVTQHVLMCRTPPQMNDEWHNLNSLFPGPLSSVLCMRGFACFSSCNPSLIPVVSSSCPDILRFFFFIFSSVQLGKMRLMIPCRALTCSHLQCFDATLYIQMNEKKPTWVCPVCDKKAPYEHLIIDGWGPAVRCACL